MVLFRDEVRFYKGSSNKDRLYQELSLYSGMLITFARAPPITEREKYESNYSFKMVLGFLLGSIISFIIFFVRNAKEIFNNSQIAHPQGSDRVKIFSGLLLRHTTGKKKKSHFARVCTKLNSMRERERSETGEVTLFVLHTGVGTR